MYLAKTNDTQIQAPFYVGVLQRIIDGDVVENKSSIDSAIKEAKEIAIGNKTVFSINNNNYFLITTLLSKFKNELTTLEVNNINMSTYTQIINILR
jgi:hypothetical protein